MMTTLCLAIVGSDHLRPSDLKAWPQQNDRRRRPHDRRDGGHVDGSDAAGRSAEPFAALDCAAGARGPMVELPLGESDILMLLRCTGRCRISVRLVNGYSGYFPPHYSALRFGLSLRDPDVLTQLAAHGINDIVVNRGEDPRGRWDDYVKSHPNARHLCTEGKQSLYRVSVPQAVIPQAVATRFPPRRCPLR